VTLDKEDSSDDQQVESSQPDINLPEEIFKSESVEYLKDLDCD
jgi:hypothetical protein